MNYPLSIKVPSIAAVLLVLCATASRSADVTSVSYRGSTFVLSRAYEDARAYKDDPNNLRANDLPAVERLVRQAPFGPNFSNIGEVAQALDAVAFPGYGSFYANQLPHSPDSLELVYIEIPRRHLNRYFVLLRLADSSVKVVEDFVAADQPEIVRVQASKSGFVYLSNGGKPLVPQRAP